MRFSSFLLPSIFIFIIQFASVSPQSLLGNWSQPRLTSSNGSYCCVPSKISIQANTSSNNLIATYFFSSASIQGSGCQNLFKNETTGSMNLIKQGYPSDDIYMAQHHVQNVSSDLSLNFRSIDYKILRVYSAAFSDTDYCDFTMNVRITEKSDSIFGSFPFPLIIFWCIIFCYVMYKRKQQAANNLEQEASSSHQYTSFDYNQNNKAYADSYNAFFSQQNNNYGASHQSYLPLNNNYSDVTSKNTSQPVLNNVSNYPKSEYSSYVYPASNNNVLKASNEASVPSLKAYVPPRDIVVGSGNNFVVENNGQVRPLAPPMPAPQAD